MNIVYYYQYFTTPRGSWSTRAYEMSRRWIASGDRVTVVTSMYDKSDLKPDGFITRLNIEGVDIRLINIGLSNKDGFITRIFAFGVYAIVACWYAITLEADVMIASSGPISVGIPVLIARYIRRIPFVFEVRDLWPEGAIQLGILRNRIGIAIARWIERTCYRSAASIVALSPGMAAWIRERYNIDHVEVIPNASDIDLFSVPCDRKTLPEWALDKNIVLYTGSLGLMDDCRQLVQLAAFLQRINRDAIAIVIIGDGKEKTELEGESLQLGLNNIHFLGLLPKRDVAAWLCHAVCALMVFRSVPCLDTVSPNKMFDAFAAGVPIVQTTQGWIKELLEREDCGLTVPANDPASMAHAVLRLLDDTTLHCRQAENAKRLAREHYDREILSAKMRQCLLFAAGMK